MAPFNLSSTAYHIHNFTRFVKTATNFRRTNQLIRENLSKYMVNLVKPEGKPKNRQSFQNKILILSTDSSTNFDFENLTYF